MAITRIIAVIDGKQRQIEVDFDAITTKTLHITLTNADISNGFVILSPAPSSTPMGTLEWAGVGQFYGADFDITGVKLNFLPRLLPKLQDGDEITVTYK